MTRGSGHLATVEDDSSDFIEEESFQDDAVDNGQDNTAVVGRGATRAVSCLRWIVFGVLAFVALVVCVGVFAYGVYSEVAIFRSQFEAHAARVLDAFETGAQRRLKSLQTISVALTAYAQASNLTWPFVTMKDFEIRAGMALNLADAVSVIMLPLVADNETRKEWIEYTQSNHDWMWEGLLVQSGYNQTKYEEIVAADIASMQSTFPNEDDDTWITYSGEVKDDIHTFDMNYTLVPDESPGPWFPFWQMAPSIPFPELININPWIFENNYMMYVKEMFVSWSFDTTENSDQVAFLELFLRRQGDRYEGGPLSSIFVPIFENNQAQDKVLVGSLFFYIYWQLYFEDVLPENAYGVIVVLENTLNQTFSYEINGPRVVYLGLGDRHDDSYDFLEAKTEFGSFIGKFGDSLPAEDRWCAYRIRVYPSDKMLSEYLTKLPLEMAVILGVTFLVTSFVFLTYDYVVERRQKIVLSEAIRTGKVVNSLFPDNVRDRLYENEAAVQDQHETGRNFLKVLTGSSSSGRDGSKPIADLYPNCTVLFADIKGFTKWSSQREPAEVFTLLEALYGSFDKSAKRLSVCKIETIGDCYLAVTGLPHPQDDHAERMARFAITLNTKMNQIVHNLVSDLGSDTVQLQMRVGLHSGPVTAGVLRGEKARFQLFGDTVNTASRMESTGEGGRIQLSQETADLLIGAGKAHWVEPRETLVEAKGKGALQNFWLKKELFSVHETTSTASSMRNGSMMSIDSSLQVASRKGSMSMGSIAIPSNRHSSVSWEDSQDMGNDSMILDDRQQEEAPHANNREALDGSSSMRSSDRSLAV